MQPSFGSGLQGGTPLTATDGTAPGQQNQPADYQQPTRRAEGRSVEDALRESEEKFRSIVESSPMAMYFYRLDPDSRVIFSGGNPSSDRIIGLAHKSLLGKAIEEAFPNLANTEIPEMYRKVALGELGPQAFEISYKDARFSGHYNVHVFRTGNRTIAVNFFDISARRQMEDALREAELRYRTLFEQSPDGVLTMDPETTKPIDFNDHACRQLGYTREEFANLTVFDWDAGSKLETIARMAQVERERRLDFETRHKTKSGEIRNVLVTAQILTLSGREVHHCICRDITEQKRAEGEKEKLQAQLLHAQKMEGIGQLAGGVAHDFNNMLAAILLQISILRKQAHISPQAGESLKELEAEAKRAANLTRQLLVFSRRSKMQRKDLDLFALIENMMKMLRRLIGEHISMDLFGERPCWINADPGMIEQVVMNLAINSRDAMPQGGKLTFRTSRMKITSTTTHSNPEARIGKFVCLRVVDTGCGMDSETLSHLFEPFFTTKADGQGTGLGLATVYGIVKQHQGWIEVQSAPGQGALFQIFLPALPVDFPNSAQEQDEDSAPGGTETILLVEDEPSVRNTLSRFLESKGYTVLVAENSASAAEVWRANTGKIDLLYTDMVMPGGNGLELARQLRLEKPTLPVLISSGYSADLLDDAKVDAEFSFLEKPCSPLELGLAIRNCLEGKVG